MQNRNDEPRLQHAPPRLPRTDGGRGRVNRRALGVGRVSECRKVTSQKPGGNFRQPQSEAEDRTIWPCRDHERRSSYHRRIFFEVPLDISPGMLTVASIESKKRWNNIVYDLSTEESRFSPNTYDFVHTYIVLQHIPVSKGQYNPKDNILLKKCLHL